MAIGNPFGLGGNSVTVGVVSYKGRAMPLGSPGTARGHDPDRRRDQPRQLRRSAAQHARRGHRHQHADHHPGPAAVGGRRASRCRSTWPRRSCPSSASTGRSCAAGWACRSRPSPRTWPAPTGMKDNKGALINDVTADSPAEKAGLKAGRRGRRRGRPRDRGQRRPLALHRVQGAGHDREPARAARRRASRRSPSPWAPSPTRRRTRGQRVRRPRRSSGMTLRNLTPDMAERLELPRGSQGRGGHRRRGGRGRRGGRPAARRRHRQRQRRGRRRRSTEFEHEIDRARPDGRGPSARAPAGRHIHSWS